MTSMDDIRSAIRQRLMAEANAALPREPLIVRTQVVPAIMGMGTSSTPSASMAKTKAGGDRPTKPIKPNHHHQFALMLKDKDNGKKIAQAIKQTSPLGIDLLLRLAIVEDHQAAVDYFLANTHVDPSLALGAVMAAGRTNMLAKCLKHPRLDITSKSVASSFILAFLYKDTLAIQSFLNTNSPPMYDAYLSAMFHESVSRVSLVPVNQVRHLMHTLTMRQILSLNNNSSIKCNKKGRAKSGNDGSSSVPVATRALNSGGGCSVRPHPGRTKGQARDQPPFPYVARLDCLPADILFRLHLYLPLSSNRTLRSTCYYLSCALPTDAITIDTCQVLCTWLNLPCTRVPAPPSLLSLLSDLALHPRTLKCAPLRDLCLISALRHGAYSLAAHLVTIGWGATLSRRTWMWALETLLHSLDNHVLASLPASMEKFPEMKAANNDTNSSSSTLSTSSSMASAPTTMQRVKLPTSLVTFVAACFRVLNTATWCFVHRPTFLKLLRQAIPNRMPAYYHTALPSTSTSTSTSTSATTIRMTSSDQQPPVQLMTQVNTDDDLIFGIYIPLVTSATHPLPVHTTQVLVRRLRTIPLGLVNPMDDDGHVQNIAHAAARLGNAAIVKVLVNELYLPPWTVQSCMSMVMCALSAASGDRETHEAVHEWMGSMSAARGGGGGGGAGTGSGDGLGGGASANGAATNGSGGRRGSTAATTDSSSKAPSSSKHAPAAGSSGTPSAKAPLMSDSTHTNGCISVAKGCGHNELATQIAIKYGRLDAKAAKQRVESVAASWSSQAASHAAHEDPRVNVPRFSIDLDETTRTGTKGAATAPRRKAMGERERQVVKEEEYWYARWGPLGAVGMGTSVNVSTATGEGAVSVAKRLADDIREVLGDELWSRVMISDGKPGKGASEG
ncbi:hypothetical protein BCR44DRAFT_1428911, partial [Catenaria anguillulae PL171]